MLVLVLMGLIWQINTYNVFRKEEFPLTYLNLIHTKTRNDWVKRLILNRGFSDSLSVDETKRRLRSLGIFRRVESRTSNDTVYLTLRDAFSLSIFLDYKFYNAKKEITLGMEEDNFLGTLIGLNFYYFLKYDRNYYQTGAKIPAFPLRTTDLVLYSQRGEHLRKDMLMINPFITPLVKTYLSGLFVRQKKYEYLYREGLVFDTSEVNYNLYSLKLGRAVRKKFTFVPYCAFEYLTTKDTVFRRIGGGIYYVNIKTFKSSLMRRSLYPDYLQKGIIARVELYPVFKQSQRFSSYFDLKTGRKSFYLNTTFIYSLSRSSGYLKLKNKFYARLPWRFTLFSLFEWGVIHDVTIALSYDNILVFSLGANNGMYAYPPHYFNGREMLIAHNEIKLFGPRIKKLVAFDIAGFYTLGNAARDLKYLYRSLGISLRMEVGALGPSAIYAFNIGFKDLKSAPFFSLGTTLDFQ